MGNPRWTPEYRRNRRTVLARDGYRCQIEAPGCAGEATTADHIVPRKWGGTDELVNLRAACAVCNQRRSDGMHRPPEPPASPW